MLDMQFYVWRCTKPMVSQTPGSVQGNLLGYSNEIFFLLLTNWNLNLKPVFISRLFLPFSISISIFCMFYNVHNLLIQWYMYRIYK